MTAFLQPHNLLQIICFSCHAHVPVTCMIHFSSCTNALAKHLLFLSYACSSALYSYHVYLCARLHGISCHIVRMFFVYFLFCFCGFVLVNTYVWHVCSVLVFCWKLRHIWRGNICKYVHFAACSQTNYGTYTHIYRFWRMR
jgi:hypothetical protein